MTLLVYNCFQNDAVDCPRYENNTHDIAVADKLANSGVVSTLQSAVIALDRKTTLSKEEDCTMAHVLWHSLSSIYLCALLIVKMYFFLSRC